MKTKRTQALITALILSALFTATVSADIAPPLQPPGATPGPAEYVETAVEMGYESVTIYVEDAGDLYYSDKAFDTVNARVTATFLMFNTSSIDETLDVIFPLTNMDGMGDGRFNYPEVQNFVVSVDDETVPWQEVTTPNPRGSDDPDIKWAQFRAHFPAETVVFIDISYDVQSTGYFPEATFSYILETGSGWYGPIATARVTLHLPYEASEENILFGSSNMMEFEYKTSPEPVFEGKEVHWDYENLEPTQEDNWSATIIAPHIWQEIISLRDDIAKNEAGAYAEITKWYDALIMDRDIRPGTEGLVDLNLEAYEMALVENPQDDDVLARYANFKLFLHDLDPDRNNKPETLDEIYAFASQALEIDQFNDTALSVINWIENTYGYTPPEKSNGEGATAPDISGGEEIPIKEPTKDETTALNKNVIYLLGGGLALAGLVIVLLANKMRKSK